MTIASPTGLISAIFSQFRKPIPPVYTKILYEKPIKITSNSVEQTLKMTLYKQFRFVLELWLLRKWTNFVSMVIRARNKIIQQRY